MEFVIGIFVGALLYWLFLERKKKLSGTFVIDFTDPLKDVCRIEMDDNLNDLCSKKYAIFKIKTYMDSQN